MIITIIQFFYSNTKQMKKFIINQNNLPKIIKPQQNSLRTKMNKPVMSISSMSKKASTSQSLLEISDCILALDNYFTKELQLQKAQLLRIQHYLKNYRDSVSCPSIDNICQSLKLNKIKLKFGNKEQKENTTSPKQQKLSILLADKDISDRKNNSFGRNVSVNVSQKLEKINNFHEINQFSYQKFQKKSFEQQYQMISTLRCSTEKKQTKLNDFQKKIAQKQQEIKTQRQKIQKLNSYVQTLDIKDKQKSEKLIKLTQTNIDLQQKCHKYQKQIKKTTQKMKQSLKQKNQQIDQLTQRHKTAQSFYELTRTDLTNENDYLLIRIKQIQKQLISVYQVSNSQQQFIYQQAVKCWGIQQN